MMKSISTWCFFLGIFVTVPCISRATTTKASDYVRADSVLYQLWMRRLQTAPPISPATNNEIGKVQERLTTTPSSHDKPNFNKTKVPESNEIASKQNVNVSVLDQESLISKMTQNVTNTSTDADGTTVFNKLNVNSTSSKTSDEISNTYENFTTEELPSNCLNTSERVENLTTLFQSNQTLSLCLEEQLQDDVDFQKACNESVTGSWNDDLDDTEDKIGNTTSVDQENFQPCVLDEGQDLSLQNVSSDFEKSELYVPSKQPTKEQPTEGDLIKHETGETTETQSDQTQNASTLTSSEPSTLQINTVYSSTFNHTSQQLTRSNSSSAKPQQNVSTALQPPELKVIQNVTEQLKNVSVLERLSLNDPSNVSISQSQQSSSQEQRLGDPYKVLGQTSEAYTDFSTSQKQAPDDHPDRVTSQTEPPDFDDQPSSQLGSSSTLSSGQDKLDTQTQRTQSFSPLLVETQIPKISPSSYVESNPSTEKPTNSGYMPRTPEYDPLSNRGGPFLRKPNAFDFLMMGQIATAKRTESQREFREGNLEASAMICGLLNKKFCRLSIGGHCC